MRNEAVANNWLASGTGARIGVRGESEECYREVSTRPVGPCGRRVRELWARGCREPRGKEARALGRVVQVTGGQLRAGGEHPVRHEDGKGRRSAEN